MTEKTELELQRGLGRVEGQLASLHTKVDRLVSVVNKNETIADDRLSDLEHWQTAMLSKAKTVAAVISLGVTGAIWVVRFILGAI